MGFAASMVASQNGSSSFASDMGISFGLGGAFGAISGSSTPASRAFQVGVGRSIGFEYQAGKNMGFLGRRMIGGVFGEGALSFLGRAAGPAFTLASVYSGYKEGGVLGAAKEGISSGLQWGAFELGASVFGSGMFFGATAAVAGGYGYYKLGEASRKHRKRLRAVEMGSDLVDRFGTISTMRQRSLAAIQKSYVNGRVAVGSEAAILSNSYLR